jgi:hypothetical protein
VRSIYSSGGLHGVRCEIITCGFRMSYLHLKGRRFLLTKRLMLKQIKSNPIKVAFYRNEWNG